MGIDSPFGWWWGGGGGSGGGIVLFELFDGHITQEFVDAGRMTEFRQPLQVQSHLEMPRILVQLGHIQRT